MSESTNNEAGTAVAGRAMTDLLSAVISKAFDNEEEFLSEFRGFCEGLELKECYMAGSKTRIEVLDLESGETWTDYIPSIDFLYWCEGR